MKIQLKSDANAKQVASVRSQITSKGDLKKFDEYLAKYDSLDTDNSTQVSAAKASCFGENSCENITITVKL